MNKYYSNFIDYKTFVEHHQDLSLEEIYKILELRTKQPEFLPNRNATVILGYSGNGKSTYICEIQKSNPNCVAISMDDVHRDIIGDNNNLMVNPYMVVELFGERLEQACLEGKEIIIDGNFLNLFTRLTLIDTLHSFGYYVTGIDILLRFDKIINLRIMDFAGRDMSLKITTDNVHMYEGHPIFIARKNHILKYHEVEKQSSFIEEQQKLGIVPFRLDRYIKLDEYGKQITSASQK